MKTEAEIIAKSKAHHDRLSKRYYSGTSGLSKEDFETQHGKIWSSMRFALIHSGYIQPPGPTLEDRVAALEAKAHD